MQAFLTIEEVLPLGKLTLDDFIANDDAPGLMMRHRPATTPNTDLTSSTTTIIRRDSPGQGAGMWFTRLHADVGGRLVLGRGLNVDIFLGELEISRQHIAFVREADGWRVDDLRSTYGSVVGDEPLVPGRPVRLSSGDELRLGGGGISITFLDPSALHQHLVGVRRMLGLVR